MKQTDIQLLLVDDNPVDAALAQRMLQMLETDLHVATQWVDSAAKAVEEVHQHRYDVMLLDYQLPGASGLDVLEQIHKLPEAQQPAVIMLTASGSETVAVEAMKNGARDYLRKDELSIAPLTRAIIAALSQKRMQDQLAQYLAETKADLDMARKLQHALLPQRFPSFPPAAGPGSTALRFRSRYVSTTELGGDFYDVFPISDNEAGVLICDVMGHGVRAALVTAMICALAEELRPAAADPGQFLGGMNKGLLTILSNTREALFASAFYAIVQVSQGRVRYANAGHPLPLHVCRHTSTAEPLSFPDNHFGPVLGMFDDAEFPVASRSVHAGDQIILFTDGLFEVVGANGEELGRDRLLAAVQARASASAEELLDHLVANSRAFAETGEFSDDVCLVGVEIVRTGEEETVAPPGLRSDAVS